MSRRVNVMAPEISAYVAGLIDGEGTVTLTRLHRQQNRRLVVSIANTELQLLEFVRCHAGAGKITRKRTISTRHTPSYCFAISGLQALDLLSQVEPHLRSYKRIRTQLALTHYRRLTPRNGKYTASLKLEREHFEQTFLAATPRGTGVCCPLARQREI